VQGEVIGLITPNEVKGVEMMLADLYKIPVGVALGVVAGILIISVIASIALPRKEVDVHDLEREL
jgi:hypothetical protein